MCQWIVAAATTAAEKKMAKESSGKKVKFFASFILFIKLITFRNCNGQSAMCCCGRKKQITQKKGQETLMPTTTTTTMASQTVNKWRAHISKTNRRHADSKSTMANTQTHAKNVTRIYYLLNLYILLAVKCFYFLLWFSKRTFQIRIAVELHELYYFFSFLSSSIASKIRYKTKQIKRTKKKAEERKKIIGAASNGENVM